MEAKAEVFKRTVKNYPSQKVEDRFYFRLIGRNGEIVAASESYASKQSVMEALTTYFSDFEIVDQTL
jgi:Domain of unknown function (DUF1508)